MNRFIITFLLAAISFSGHAQRFPASDYIYPLEGVSRLYSANFGELRSDHFHSGIDIKTEGVIGKRVVAVADGYISRISMSPYGYGLALYVAHKNGSTSVYGHLSRFNDAVAKYVEVERYRTKSQSVNLFCTPSQFVVKQGDLIAYSGNSGSSGGPHLHFEVRDSGKQEPLNVVSSGIIKPHDTIAPLIFKIHYIETDTLQGVVREAPRKSYNVVKSGENYMISGGGNIAVGRSGYFVLEVSDRRNEVTNTFATHRISASIDAECFFEYVMDGFSFSNSRYSNAIGYYPLMIESRNEVIRLSATEHTDMSHYTKLLNRGVVTSQEGVKRTMKVEVADDCGNVSLLNVSLLGKADKDCYIAEEVSADNIVKVYRQFEYKGNGISVSIPARTLYDSAIFSCEESQGADSTILSKVYKIMDVTTPLHSYMNISIKADVPFELQSKVGMVCVGRSKSPSFIGGEYRYGSVTARSRNTGSFYVVADTEPPTLKLGISEGSQQGGSSYFTCTISDNLSGVSKYSATLDGEWIALDLDKGRIRHDFRTKPSGTSHVLIIEAEDAVGNRSKITRTFIR